MKNFLINAREFTLAFSNTLLSILKIAILSRPVSVNKIEKENPSVIILGNGPSLNSFLENNTAMLSNRDSICVNYFSRTEEYQKIKPFIYYITSPEYFVGDQKQGYSDSRKETLQAIADKTEWPMYLVVPALAKKRKAWRLKIEMNKNIKIVYANNTPIDGFKWFRHFAFKANLGMPRPHNVLIGCIWLSININYKEVFLVGADHSWIPELRVDQNNQVMVLQSHFYDKQVTNQTNNVNKPVLKPMFAGGTDKARRLHEVLEKFYYSFKSYWILKEFAESQKTKIYNGTEGSFIDAFEKINLDDL